MEKFKHIIPIIVSLLFCTSCSSSTGGDSVSVTVKDLTQPTITISKRIYEITEGDVFEIDDCFTVSDNVTKDPTIVIDDDAFDSKKAGEYKITITATDEAGNETEDSFTVVVKEKTKPTPTPTPTPESKTETKTNASSNSNSGASDSSSNQQTQPSQNTTTSNDVPSTTPSSKFFPFGEDEHDGGVAAANRCLAEYNACDPYDNDGDGVYDGYLGH